MKKISILILFFSIVFLFWGCQPAEQYVEVNIKTLNTAQRHAIKMEMDNIRNAVKVFETDKLRKPTGIDEMVREGYLPKEPKDPFGEGFTYDPVSNEVKSVTLEKIKKFNEEQKRKSEARE